MIGHPPMLSPPAVGGRAKPEPDELSSKGEDAPIGAEPRPAADDRIVVANPADVMSRKAGRWLSARL